MNIHLPGLSFIKDWRFRVAVAGISAAVLLASLTYSLWALFEGPAFKEYQHKVDSEKMSIVSSYREME